MATYKVIQDIEADDKLLGPLSLRQFVYAGVTVFCGWLSYMAVAKGAPFLLIVFIPPGLIAGFFAFPWGKEQSTEIWALARIRFLLKPRKRIWDQTGLKELVTITAPKVIEHAYTDGLSQKEVRSRLQTLAATIDSRGWAIKNTSMSPYTPTPVYAGISGVQTHTDRLIDINTLPRETPFDDTSPSEDILDPGHNPKAQQFDAMLTTNAQQHRERLIASMQQPDPIQPPAPPPSQTQATDTSDDQAILASLQQSQQQQAMQYSHLPTLQPLSAQQQATQDTPAPPPMQDHLPETPSVDTTPATPIQQVTPEPDTVILNLAHSNDLSISTLAREAKKEHGEEPDEVVIPLH